MASKRFKSAAEVLEYVFADSCDADLDVGSDNDDDASRDSGTDLVADSEIEEEQLMEVDHVSTRATVLPDYMDSEDEHDNTDANMGTGNYASHDVRSTNDPTASDDYDTDIYEWNESEEQEQDAAAAQRQLAPATAAAQRQLAPATAAAQRPLAPATAAAQRQLAPATAAAQRQLAPATAAAQRPLVPATAAAQRPLASATAAAQRQLAPATAAAQRQGPAIPQKRACIQKEANWDWEECLTGQFDPKDIQFSETERIKATLPANPTPLDFFALYLTEDMVDYIVVETNRYAQQYISANRNDLKRYSNVRNWHDTDVDEIYTFLGVVLRMGIVHKPRLHIYWSENEVYKTPIFTQLMSRDRFLLLLRFFHLTDNSAIIPNAPKDRLAKIRTFADMLRKRCKEVYYPKKELWVDESLVLFKGCLSFRQFIRTKRARFGIKLYQLCTSSGVMLDYLIYHGDIDSQLGPTHADLLTTERIPIALMDGYLGAGHVLFVDNYYTSLKLCKFMLENNTHAVGTVRPNRQQFPKELATLALEKGQTTFYHGKDNHLLAVKYRAVSNKSDNKPKIVHWLSTCKRAEMMNTNKKEKDGNVIQKPASIMHYNSSMGGVDLVDQQLDQLLVLRKSYKWYKKLAFRLLLQALLAWYKLYIFNGGNRKHDFLRFMQDVVTQMFTRSPGLNQELRAGNDNIRRLIGHDHFPSKRANTTAATRRKSMVKIC